MKKIILKQNKACPLQNAIRGFTIIETMISISLFLVVVTAGMGALLNANVLHNKAQSMRSIMDNMSFIMEDMSRNLRTGSIYHCIDDGNLITVNAHSCPIGAGISFKPASGGNQWVYYVGNNPNVSGTFSIFKSVDGNVVQLTPDEVAIDPASGFLVIGAEPSPDTQQPFVTIRLVGKITDRGAVTPFSLETSVSQRLIDR